MRAQPGIQLVVSETTTVELSAPSATFVGVWVVRLESDSFSGTVDVQGRPLKSSADFLNIDYRDRTAGSADLSVAQLDQTDIGGGLILEINAAGLDIQLDVTRSSGDLLIDVAPPLIG